MSINFLAERCAAILVCTVLAVLIGGASIPAAVAQEVQATGAAGSESVQPTPAPAQPGAGATSNDTAPAQASEPTPAAGATSPSGPASSSSASPVTSPPTTAPAEPVAGAPEPAQSLPDTASPSDVALPAGAEAATDAPTADPVDPDALSAEPVQSPSAANASSGSSPAPAKPGALPHDLSPWGMFMAADIVVKAVMIGLAAASLVTWTIWVAKTAELWAARWRLRRAMSRINGAKDLSSAVEVFARNRSTGATLVRAAAEEMVRSAPVLEHIGPDGIKERVTSRLSRVEANAGRRMTLGTGVLATIGSTAPFVGLFGTVWGIMNSFIGISQSQTTNLAVVAPGIAEALLATALGLVAAIPAVIIYNMFARSIAGYRLLLSDTAAGVERLVSWELDLRRLPRNVALASAAE